jgi:hypothetical protein
MPRIKQDWEPDPHSYDLLYNRINKAEAAAYTLESNRLTKSQIKVMMTRETEKMKLYFLTKRKDGKLISRESWELTWVNWMERHHEDSRHKRKDSGTGRFKEWNEAYGKLISDKPIQKPQRDPERLKLLSELRGLEQFNNPEFAERIEQIKQDLNK